MCLMCAIKAGGQVVAQTAHTLLCINRQLYAQLHPGNILVRTAQQAGSSGSLHGGDGGSQHGSSHSGGGGGQEDTSRVELVLLGKLFS